MARVICEEDCGNSPRKQLLKELNTAFANGSTEALSANVTDDIVWEIVGKQRVEGMSQFSAHVANVQRDRVAELRIDNIITHGTTGAVNGVVLMHDRTKYAFSDVYKFSGASNNAKIKQITSYCTEVR